jgi:ArsR family transcriptional regulator
MALQGRTASQAPGGSDPVTVFKALGDPTRLKILELLKSRGRSCCDLIARDERGLCACDIEEAVGLSQAAVSHHMALLRRAGLVHAEKRGRWVYYSRDEASIAGLAETLAKAV